MPTLKTEALCLLVMYNLLIPLYCEINNIYSITLFFFSIIYALFISYINDECYNIIQKL